MDIVNLSFEQPLTLSIKGETVQIMVFKTLEHGNIKFGVEASHKTSIDREEIRHQKMKKLNASCHQL